ncbi:hypothetical protein BGZ89_012686 [Linnemannia elongata]|nr:hypothetical protein BGZ89_012686 [Linnemannia elongata]
MTRYVQRNMKFLIPSMLLVALAASVTNAIAVPKSVDNGDLSVAATELDKRQTCSVGCNTTDDCRAACGGKFVCHFYAHKCVQ